MVVAGSRPQAVERAEPPASAQAVAAEYLYLLGRPTLRQFLRYVKAHAVNPVHEGTLRDEWHAASAVVETLAHDEAGAADDPPMGTLGPEYQPLLIEFFKDPLVRHSFNTVPTDIAIVPLDHFRATGTGDIRSAVGAIIGDNQDTAVLRYGRQQRPQRSADHCLLVVCGHENGEAATGRQRGNGCIAARK